MSTLATTTEVLPPEGTAKRGAPKGNRNGMRHGLAAGNLPRGCKHIQNRVDLLRRTLEDAVVKLRKETSIYDAANIQTAMRWERHAALAQHWLSKEAATLTPLDRLHFSREVARASTERDKAIALLELGKKQVQDVHGYIASKDAAQ